MPITAPFVKTAQPWNVSDLPWRMPTIGSGGKVSSGERLIQLLPGGLFGESIANRRINRRQNRFLAVAVVMLVAWTILWLV